jgi:4-amino-4-deoxy-L-arabinose transferase-like glycosyltransferase
MRFSDQATRREPGLSFAALPAGVWLIALALTLLHLLTNNRYGFHRDELQFLSDSRHLDWGFVSYPPFTPFIERVSTAIFGLWMPGLRLASVLAQAGVVLLVGAMAQLAGGTRRAQTIAALAAGFAPLAIFEGTEFQYTSFELFWAVLLCYGVFRLLSEQGDRAPRWWLLAGFAAGMGVETKYTTVFLIAGVLCGFLFTSARRLLFNRWFAAGVALTLLLAMPNFLWQVRHGFISFHFLQSIHQRDVEEGRGTSFWLDQLWICELSLSIPLWAAGLWRALREPAWRPCRCCSSVSRTRAATTPLRCIPCSSRWARPCAGCGCNVSAPRSGLAWASPGGSSWP